MQLLPSKLVEHAVNEIAKLPGIGKKTALRLVLHLLKEEKEDVEVLGMALINMRSQIAYCQECFNISDREVCEICSNNTRDKSIICVVEDIRDVVAVENTHQYRGVYHVLGGIISPVDGIGPGDLNIAPLVKRAAKEGVSEIIMALSATIEGDTTIFYLYRQLAGLPVKITTIARGVSFGDELEYADEVTLGRSILNRTVYQQDAV